MRKSLFYLLSSLLLTACGYSLVAYHPQESTQGASPENLRLVERLLWEQYRDFVPNSVEVTPTYFRVSKSVVVGSEWALTQKQNTSAVYFDNIDRAQLFKKRRLYQVALFDRSGLVLFRYYQTDLKKAQRFVDLVTMLAVTARLDNTSGSS